MIKEVKINNLFGQFSYNMTFHSEPDDRITFITGPNGYGKTTVLRMLHALFTLDLATLSHIPFDDFTVITDKNTFHIASDTHYDDEDDTEDTDVSYERAKSGHTLTISVSGELNIAPLTIDSQNTELPGDLVMGTRAEGIYYIADNRLYTSNDDTINDNARIADNCQDLVARMKRLDNTVKEKTSAGNMMELIMHHLTSGNKTSGIKTTTNKVNELASIGIGTSLEKPEGNEQQKELMRNFVEVHLKIMDGLFDTKDFGQEIERITLFRKIISAFEFTNKQLEVNTRYGFRFKSDDGTLIDNSLLSSGEKHLLIQVYELLFRSYSSSLVLIDEPEMSFHLAWQMEYLNSLREIANERDLQCIVATHSPTIFDDDFSLTIDLYDIVNNQQQ